MQASVGAWLEQDYAPSIPEAPVLGLIYVSSGASGSGTLQVHRVPDGALPPAGLRPTRPRDALEEPGLYLGTFLPKTGQPRYLARLGGGGAVLGEGEYEGVFGGVLVQPTGTVVAGRFPFVPTDVIAMFESDGERVTRVRWTVDSWRRMPRRTKPPLDAYAVRE
jgi:hypothetical protein